MGQVYLAENEILPGTFVVKVLHASMQTDPEAIERFKRECIIMSRLRHPNVVHCLEPGEEDGVWYLPMEWVPGETLQKKVAAHGDIPLRDRVGWALQILSGLQAAHTARPRPVVHRDLKPSNLMVTPEGVVKILDFGIAHEAGSQLTRVSNPGTPEFQAPEQLQRGAVDARTDLFALGIVLYMLFTGRHPFKRSEDQPELETQNAIVGAAPAPLTDHDPGLPPRLSDIVLRALAKDPDERFASAQEMGAALEALYRSPEEDAESEARRFALRQVARANELCDLGGRENVDEAAKFVATARALLSESPEVRLAEDRVRSHRAEIERVDLLFQKAQAAIETRRYREARSCLDLAMQLRPNDSRLRRLAEELQALEGSAAAAAPGDAGGETGPEVPARLWAWAGGSAVEADLAARIEALEAAVALAESAPGAAGGTDGADGADRADGAGEEMAARCAAWRRRLDLLDLAGFDSPPARQRLADLRERLRRLEAAARPGGPAAAARPRDTAALLARWEAP
jgi:tetratricopeptide (TPR) repeat protein